MDPRMIVAPVVTDPDALQDFIDSLMDYAPAIERAVNRLKSAPGEREAIGSLFRALHNVEGDAALCRVDLGVAIVHPIETVLARVRSDALPFTGLMAETILLAVDRLELAVARLASGDVVDGLQLLPLVQGLEELALAAPAEIDESAAAVIDAVTGFRPVDTEPLLSFGRASAMRGNAKSRAATDLRFFRTLANQFEARSPLFKGRTRRIVHLALATNAIAGETIDPEQLEAAVCMHDIGMMFLAESAWLKAGEMTSAEKLLLRAHPTYAAGLLSRMAGWSAAAEMVAQHHETPDGKGYPAGLEAARIGAGARVLAIVDAFEAVMLKHGNRGRNRSVLRAIAEINACDKQFAAEWIEPFNRVIRRTLEEQ